MPSVVHKTPSDVFVSVDEYQELMQRLSTISQSVDESQELVGRLGELKTREEQILDEWKAHLEDVEKKLNYVDEIIFEGE